MCGGSTVSLGCASRGAAMLPRNAECDSRRRAAAAAEDRLGSSPRTARARGGRTGNAG